MAILTEFAPADEICQTMLDGSHAILRTLEGTILGWTKGARQIYGWTQKEAIGAQEDELLDTTLPVPFERVLAELRVDGRWAGELRQKNKSGAEVVVQSVWLLTGGDGEDLIVESNTDITALVRAREQLVRSEQRLLLAQRAARLGIWDWDIRSNTVACSPEWFAVRGHPQAATTLSHTEWLGWVHVEDRQRVIEALFAVVCETSHFQADLRVMWPDGSIHWLQTRAQILRDEFGEAVRVIGADLDITKTKSLETKLKSANAALERSNHDLHQFAYAAGHDLKEPLRAVSICAALLSRRLRKLPNPETDELLSFIENGADRMQKMIDALLEYARASEENAPAGKTAVAAAVSDALMNLQIAVAESEAQVVVGPLPEITAHRELLTQVFQNLIGNAIKYRRDEPPYIVLSAAQAESEWVFTVADNGTGFDPAQRERIFNLFTRVKEFSDISGSGIGLAICKRIVERYGGRIWADSTLGQGSRFQFSIPESAVSDAPCEMP